MPIKVRPTEEGGVRNRCMAALEELPDELTVVRLAYKIFRLTVGECEETIMEQLMMIHRMENIEDYPIPEGWSVRTWRPGEEEIWTRICENGLIEPDDGTFGSWRSAIIERGGIVPEKDVFFVCRGDGEPEATLTAYVHADGIGDIHMVAAAPSIRGNNVNRIMLSFGMKKLDAEMLHRPRITKLTTDDFRIPAVVGYLRAGFLPVEYSTGMYDRWKKLCDDLNIHGIEMLTEKGEATGIIL